MDADDPAAAGGRGPAGPAAVTADVRNTGSAAGTSRSIVGPVPVMAAAGNGTRTRRGTCPGRAGCAGGRACAGCTRGETRCADCAWALAQHPDPRVRLALATPPADPAGRAGTAGHRPGPAGRRPGRADGRVPRRSSPQADASAHRGPRPGAAEHAARARCPQQLAHRQRGAAPGGHVVRQPDPPPRQVLPRVPAGGRGAHPAAAARPGGRGLRVARAHTGDAAGQDSPGRAAATEAMLDWLSAPNPGLVDGRLLLWSGARSRRRTPAPRTAGAAGDVALAVEVDSFVVADGAGNQFTAEVQVAAGRAGPGQGAVRAVADPAAGARPGRVPQRRAVARPARGAGHRAGDRRGPGVGRRVHLGRPGRVAADRRRPGPRADLPAADRRHRRHHRGRRRAPRWTPRPRWCGWS